MPRELGRILALYRRTNVTGDRERTRRWLSNWVGSAMRQDGQPQRSRAETCGRIGHLLRISHSMPLLQHVRVMIVAIATVMAYRPFAAAQSSLVLQGGQYPITRSLPGDQVYPDVSVGP